MGTLLTIRIEADDREASLSASERVFQAVAAAEARLSTWTGVSDLARLNSAVSGYDVPISTQLVADLEVAKRCYELTGGAFDLSVGPLVSAWGLREGGRFPNPTELESARDAVGFEALEVGTSTARRTRDALRLDEGAFGKGAGLDDASSALATDPRVRSAVLDFGGQLLVYRREPSPGTAIRVLVAHPDDRQQNVSVLELDSGSVATTGNGERAIEIDGERLGHVLDPRSGRPAPDFGSLTVWVDSRFDRAGTLADCLSTGLYVLGPDAALAFAARHPGIEVLVAERVNEGIRVRKSSGLASTSSKPPATVTSSTWSVNPS